MLTKAQLKRRVRKILAPFHRLFLRNRDFSILSNNCFGGMIYDTYGLSYRTPTIGLWIPPADYVKFLNNLDYYLGCEMVQIPYTECHVRDLLIERKKAGRYRISLDEFVIGRLDDVDIIFIHYHDFATAQEKWNRRKTRLNRDNLMVKMNDQNGCTEEDMKAFLKLDYKHKILITANEDYKDIPDVVYMKKYKKDGYIVNDVQLWAIPVNFAKYLNNMKKK